MHTDLEFNTETTAYKLISRLSQLRQSNDALAFGETVVRYSDENVLIFERQFYDDIVLVAVNRQPDVSYNVQNIETLLPVGNYSDYLEGLLNGSDINVSSSEYINIIESLHIPAGGAFVWEHNADNSAQPSIGNVVSTMGRAGNKVYIYGDGLSGNIDVKFGDVSAYVESNTDDQIVTYVPENAVAGDSEITVSKNGNISNPFTYRVLSGDQNQIIFHVSADTNLGENIYIVGNVPELGNWDPNESSEAMLNPNYPEWFLPVSVPKDTTIEFKFIKKDASGNVTWESGYNHIIQSSSEDAGTIDTPLYEWRY